MSCLKIIFAPIWVPIWLIGQIVRVIFDFLTELFRPLPSTHDSSHDYSSSYNATSKRKKEQKKIQHHQKRLSSLEELKQLSPIAFEHFVKSMFESLGYSAKTTKVSGDHGVDLILHKGDRKAIAQCKRYEGNVSASVVRDFYGTMIHEDAAEGFIVTTGSFTLPGQKWAQGKPIRFVDGIELSEWLNVYQEQEHLNGQNEKCDRDEINDLPTSYLCETAIQSFEEQSLWDKVIIVILLVILGFGLLTVIGEIILRLFSHS